MKKILFIISVILFALPITADASVFASNQVGTTPTNGFVLQTNGTASSWVSTTTLGIPAQAVASVFGRTGAVIAQTGDYTTAQITEVTNLFFTNARGIAATLTGYTSGAGTISSSDSILSAIQKLNGNISALVTGVSSVSNVDGSITTSPTTGAVVHSLNTAHANIFSALQSFSNASSSLLSVTKELYIGGTATTTIDSSGNIVIPSGSSLTNTGVSNGCATWATGVLGSTGTACGSGSGGVTGVTATYPIISSGGSTPNITTAISTSTLINAGTGISTSSTASGAITVTNTGVISLGNGTGTTCSGTNPGTCNINTTQNITTLSNLTVAGFVQTTSGGLLSSAALTSGQVTTALGFTPFGGTNPLPVANGGTASTTGIANGITYYDPTNTFLTASTSFVRLASGNVGIGIANPASKLDVAGDINFASNSAIRQGGGQFAYGSSTTNSLFVGDGAGGTNGLSSSTLLDNVGIGRNALKSIAATAGQVPTDNVGVGYQAMFNTTSGFRNVGLGTNALYSNTIGRDNMAIGYQSLFLNTIGVQNVAIGFVALQANVGGSSNIAIGYHALLNNVSGNSNLAFGVQAGEGTTGSNNVQIGDSQTAASASSVTTGSNNFQLGYRVALPDPTANNQLDIGNILFGTSLDGTDHALSTGNLGVGTSSPWARLSVNAKAGGAVPSFVVATSTTGFATTTAFEVDQNGNVLAGFNGANVGIGTTSPYSLLSVAGNLVIGAATAGGTLGDLFLPKLGVAAGSFLAVDGTGKMIATTTPSGSNSAFSPAANYATTGALPSNTYVNGTSGVGATITEVGTGALSVDGASPTVGQTVLVKNEGTASHNGLYDVTATGSGIAAFVLTRDSAYNSSSNIIPGIITYVISGTANADEFWAMVSAAPITLGTTALNYTEVSGGGANVTSVSNSDSTLTISPTTGAVVASLNLAHANTWSGGQIFGNASSTNFFGGTLTGNTLSIGGTASTTISTAGLLTAPNIINSSLTTNALIYANGSKQETSVTLGTGIGFSGGAISNTGVTSIVAGTNITISGGTGAVTINSTGASFSGTVGQFDFFTGTNTAAGTSTIFASTAGNLGFGASTTPYANYAYQPQASSTDANKPLWELDLNEAASIIRGWVLDQFGNIYYGGDTPTLTNCGNPISVTGNDQSGTVVLNGGTAANACTVNFAHPKNFSKANQCSLVFAGTGFTYTVSSINKTGVTFAFSSNYAGQTFYYICASDI